MAKKVGVRERLMSPLEPKKSRRRDGFFMSGTCTQRRVSNTPDSMW
jgi:hypothetical protein